MKSRKVEKSKSRNKGNHRRAGTLGRQQATTGAPGPSAGNSAPLQRELTAADLGDIGWVECAPGEFRINADLTCARCGAYQAADCDPTRKKEAAVRMTVQLLNAVGWRMQAECVVCPNCVRDD